MDESVEQQKRVAALTAQLERSRRGRRPVPEDELKSCLQQLEFQRAAEYIARLRRFYSGYTMADDLFTWTMDNASIHLLADGAYATPQGVIAEIRRLDNFRFVAKNLNLID